MLPFFKEETVGLRTQITFTGKKCEIYIPKYFINKNDNTAIAVEIGDRIETTGLFWFNVEGKWYEMQLPLKIQFKLIDIYTFMVL